MRRDFDFVTMADYQADMTETADRAAGVITALRGREKNIERMLGEAVLAAGGKVTISRDRLAHLVGPTLTIWRNEADDTLELRADSSLTPEKK